MKKDALAALFRLIGNLKMKSPEMAYPIFDADAAIIEAAINHEVIASDLDVCGTSPSSQPGGCDYISFDEAQKVFQTYIDCEMRDPSGLDKTAKAMLSYNRMIAYLKS